MNLFLTHVNRGIENWMEAGEILARLRELNPNIYREINARAPWISVATLVMFERVGCGVIYPRVLLLPPLTANRVAKLSYEEQKKACNQPMSEIKRQFPPTLPVKHNAVQHHARTNSPERSHVAALPCVGFFKVTVMNGKAFVQKSSSDPDAIPVVLDGHNSVVLQVMKRPEYVDPEEKRPLEITEDLTPNEKAWRQFRNEV